MDYETELGGIVEFSESEVVILPENDPDKVCLCTINMKRSKRNLNNFIEELMNKDNISALKFSDENSNKSYKPLQRSPYVYAVEPKEYAQNISDVGAREELKNYILSLAATIPQASGLSAKAYAEKLDQSQTLLHGITRRPLAVGYVNGDAEFGWMFGSQVRDPPGGKGKAWTLVLRDQGGC